jgi:hypothetical protein
VQARLVILLVLAMAVPSVSRAQVTSEPGVVLEATPIRIAPTATVPLATLPRGMDVTVLAIEDGWLQVAFEDLRYGRRVGYVPRSTVSFSLPTPPTARVDTPAGAPRPTPVVASAPAPAKPVDKRAAAANTAKPSATSAAASVATAKAAAAVKPAARPPVQLVEADFPDLVTPAQKTVRASAAAAAAKPAARPPVRLVEAEFPDLVTPPRKTAAAPKARQVVSIGDAFADAANAPAAGAASNAAGPAAASALTDGTARPSAATTAPRPAVRLVHAEFPAVASAAVDADDPKPASRSVASIGNAFPALGETAPAAGHDMQLVDGHVSFDLGVDASVLDDPSADVELIVARVLKHTVLPRVRQLAKTLPPVPGARGIRVLYRIPLQAGPQASKEYRLELVADMPHVVAFAVAGTTDEAFVAGSTLRVDGNTMRVDLTRIAD